MSSVWGGTNGGETLFGAILTSSEMSNTLSQNTADTYNLLNYKMQCDSVPVESPSGQFDSLGLCFCLMYCMYVPDISYGIS
jgi:hypothetical protein